MDERIGAVKARLKMLGYTSGDTDDAMIAWEMKRAEQYIMDFCNVQKVPEELLEVLVDMVAAQILMTRKATGALKDYDFAAAVKSIQEGDTTVSYAVGEGSQTPEQRFDTLMSRMAAPPIQSLLRYRRLRW